MDRRVKERLVGATILVVLVVLIVPELLSGPKHATASRPVTAPGEPVRHVTMDLATSRALPGADEPGAAGAGTPPDVGAGAGVSVPETPETLDSPHPPAAGGSADAVAHGAAADTPSIATLQAQPTPGVLERGVPSLRSPRESAAAHDSAADSGRHGWAAQLGSFVSRANAEKLARALKSQGFAAFVSASGTGAALRYRVRVGPMADRIAAEKAIVKLKKAGHAAHAVAT